jgi:hypothetical protein|tara:strand:- start:595 stop:744 length:150 start_codon:yes stop_codon:yes gene_type:complete
MVVQAHARLKIPSADIRRAAGVVRNGWTDEGRNVAESKLLWNALEGIGF